MPHGKKTNKRCIKKCSARLHGLTALISPLELVVNPLEAVQLFLISATGGRR
jgi:hypothetical protein